jgi:uncharacterized protein (TIGR02646 family)
MIKVDRSPQPRILQRQASTWENKLLEARKQFQGAATQPSRAKARRAMQQAEEKYRHQEVKKALVTMFHGKCAYCESKILHVDYGHIEHYRPKSRFPKWTFAWSNLLLACGMCNGPEHKGDRFPEAAEDGPPIDPSEEDPGGHFNFHFDPATRLASVYGKTPRGMTMELLVGLNRLELRAFRSTVVRKLIVLARHAKTDPEAEHLLNESIRNDAQFAAFARMIAANLS